MKSIVELVSNYHSGKSSPVEIVDSLLADIDSSSINAYITIMADQAREQAELAEQQLRSGAQVGQLVGVPIAIKDLVHVAGQRTTLGAEEYANNISTEDAEVVQLLRRAGAIIVGKTNTHQLAYGSTGDRSFFGPVRNPKDASRVSGGSSSGSAASVAAGLAYGAVGTDTSASIRLPAALCGVVGMKATLGLVSKQGVYALSDTLDHIGPITSCVKDNALLLEVMSNSRPGSFSSRIGHGIGRMVIGVPETFYSEYVSPPVAQSMLAARKALEDAGALVKTIEIDNIYDIYNAQQLVLKAEAYAQYENALNANALFIKEVQDRLLTGKGVPAAEYIRNLKYQSAARASFDKALESVDILLTPTCGITAPPIDERSTRINGEDRLTPWLLTRLTAPTNFSGHPSLSVPFLADAQGLPIGLQLIGRWNDEASLYQVASQLETASKS